MKTVRIMLLLLLLLVVTVTINAIYINNVTNRLNAALDAVPDIGDTACLPAVRALLALWRRHADYVGLSVYDSTVNHVSEQAALLLSCAERHDAYGFYSAMTLLRDSIADLRRLEVFSVGNLF